MNSNHSSSELVQEPSIDADKLSYEIFSILESKFLFGYDNHDHINNNNNNNGTLWKPKPGNNNVVPSLKNQRGKICVLSIDGGGMKNILSGKTLAYLETSLKQKSGNPNARIADYFDVAAGTGIGGVFTSMLFGTSDHMCPLYKADDTWRFLVTQGNQLYGNYKKPCNGLKKFFGGRGRVSRHADSGFENSMKELFTVNGKCLTLKNTLKPVLIPCYDLSSSAPFLFSRADALETDSYDFNLWEVCRATSAFPGLFDPVEMKSTDGKTRCVGVDGGLAMSNPTAAAITHVLHNKQEFPHVRGLEDILLLSLGTAQVVEGSCDYEKVKGWQGGQWCRPMARISGDASADMVDHAVAMAFGQTGNYVRIQANGSNMGGCGLNVDSDPSPGNVKMLATMADEMLRQKNVESVLFGGKKITDQTNLEKLDWFAGELVLEHQRRSSRIAPTVSLKQAS